MARLQKAAEAFKQLNQRKKGKKKGKKGPAGAGVGRGEDTKQRRDSGVMKWGDGDTEEGSVDRGSQEWGAWRSE